MKKANLLILDDDFANLRLYEHILTQAGYDVTAVTEPQEALELMIHQSFDLVMTDIRMPEMDGFELATRVKRMDPRTAVIFITGYGNADTAVQALQRGADGLLLKPLGSVDELTATVSRVLTERSNKLDADRLKTLQPLFEMTEKLFAVDSHQSFDDILQEITRETFHAQFAGVYRRQDNTGDWKCVAGEDLCRLSGLDHLECDLILEKSDRQNQRIITNEHLYGSRIYAWLAANDLLGLFVPVIHTDSHYIFYGIRARETGRIEAAEEELVAILARQATIAIENVRLYAHLSESIKKVEESQKELALSEKMAALGRLMASVAHEINNPLQAVRNCLHLAGREDISEDQRKEYFNLAINEVERLSNLAQITLEYHRPGGLDCKQTDINQLLEMVLTLVEPQLRQNGVQVHQNFSNEPVTAEIFPDQIQQVILNLLINALDSMVGYSEDPKIWIDLKMQKDKVYLTIEDNGPGISAENEEKAFEPFFSTKPHGTGQGLAICYKLVVNIHHGEIRFIEPVYGHGARVEVMLPRSVQNAEC